MDNFKVSLKILRDILLKKKDALTIILDISQNQETILSAVIPSGSPDFFAETVNEKQRQIDKVLECDDVFQGVFGNIRQNLDEIANDNENRDEIIGIQSLIKDVTELDVNIRAQELKNNRFLKSSRKEPSNKAFTQTYRKQILSEYGKHKKNNGESK